MDDFSVRESTPLRGAHTGNLKDLVRIERDLLVIGQAENSFLPRGNQSSDTRVNLVVFPSVGVVLTRKVTSSSY
jgi:hypothetical protein